MPGFPELRFSPAPSAVRSVLIKRRNSAGGTLQLQEPRPEVEADSGHAGTERRRAAGLQGCMAAWLRGCMAARLEGSVSSAAAKSVSSYRQKNARLFAAV